jgi:hypothetical protein
MPFQSEKQRRYLHANHPEIAKRWEKEYATGGISNHFRKKYSLGSMVTQARQDSDGIEERLEQLGGDVTSAEQLLQQINQRLQTAGSSVPKGGLGTLAAYTPPNPAGGYQQPLPGVGPNVGNEIAVPSMSGTPTQTPLPEDKGGGTLSGPAGNQNPFDQMSPAEKVKQVQIRMMQQDIKPPGVEDFFREVIRTQGTTDKLYPTSGYPGLLPSLDKIHPDFKTGQPMAQLPAGGQPLQSSLQTTAASQFPGFGVNPTPSLEELYPNAGQNQISNFKPLRGGAEMMELAGIPMQQSQGPRVLGIGSQNLATGGIANHFKFKNGGNATKNIKGQPHMLAYITPKEAKTLENLGGQKTMTKEGIPAYPPSDNYGGNWGSSNEDKGENSSDSGWSPGVSHSGSPPDKAPDEGGHSRFEPGSGYYGETVTTSTGGDNDYPDPILKMVKPNQTIHDEILDKHAHRFKSIKDLTWEQRERWAKDKYEDFKTAKSFMSIAAGPFGWLSAGKAIIDANKRKEETINELKTDIKTLTDLGYPTHHHTVDTLIQSLNQEILDMTQPKSQKDGDGGDGPTPLVVPEVMDEMADATGQIDMFDAWSNIKQKQALRAGLFADEDQAKVGEWVGDQRLLVNSGGLANLFRVKNQ